MVSVDDPLASIRDVLRRHEWQAALDAARATSFDDPGLEADRLDLEADAAWWLGRGAPELHRDPPVPPAVQDRKMA